MYDTLLHISSETETVFRALNNFFVYYLLLTGGNSGKKYPAIVSINQLYSRNSFDTGIAKYNEQNIATTRFNFSNYRPQYCQVFHEMKQGADYTGVSFEFAKPISNARKIKGGNANWAYITKYIRMDDDIEFYFIQMTQTFGGYLNRNSYKAISELLQYIQHHFPGEYIIVGDFNVQGHEKIFAHYLGEEKYHILPLYKIMTTNDYEGVASPDGAVISKKLYQRVEYEVDFYPGYSYQHYILAVKMYKNGEIGTINTTTKQFLKFISSLNSTSRNYFINNAGIFNPNDVTMTGSKSAVSEVKLSSRGPKTFSMNNFNTFLVNY